MTIDDLLLKTIDLEYHPTVMAAAGPLAVKAATDAKAKGGYVLVVEGAVPTGGGGKFCTVWPGMTMLNAVTVTPVPRVSSATASLNDSTNAFVA